MYTSNYTLHLIKRQLLCLKMTKSNLPGRRSSVHWVYITFIPLKSSLLARNLGRICIGQSGLPNQLSHLIRNNLLRCILIFMYIFDNTVFNASIFIHLNICTINCNGSINLKRTSLYRLISIVYLQKCDAIRQLGFVLVYCITILSISFLSVSNWSPFIILLNSHMIEGHTVWAIPVYTQYGPQNESYHEP